MSKLRFEISMSLDGFAAGRDQSEENALGRPGVQEVAADAGEPSI